MVFTTAELTGYVGSYLWPFFRIGAMMMVAPIFGGKTVPTKIRLFFALTISIVVAPLLPDVPNVDPLSLDALFIILQQLIIGVMMGFALQLAFSAFVIGGQIIAMQMGLGFSSMVDPMLGVTVPVLAQFLTIMATLIFMALNGHLIIIEVVVGSFYTIPISADALIPDSFHQLVAWGSYMFAAGVLIALPALSALMLVYLTFGVMSRAAPSLQIFSVGFPMLMIVGFAIIWVALPVLLPQSLYIFDLVFDLARRLSGQGVL